MKIFIFVEEAQTDHTVEVAFGSSGRLFAQISNGAPFQIFFSADQDKPERLLASGLAVPGSSFTYATGALVVWNADEHAAVPDTRALSHDSELRIAIANPRVAPYGAAAMEAIASLALSEALADRLVLGENIAQTYQFVDSGNAPLGFVAKSQVFLDGSLRKGSAWEVPANLHAPIRQDAVLLTRAQDCVACQQFLRLSGVGWAKAHKRDCAVSLPLDPDIAEMFVRQNHPRLVRTARPTPSQQWRPRYINRKPS